MSLTPQQEKFCLMVVEGMNGTNAAIAAGYSKVSANSKASQLMAQDNIKARISELQQAMQEAVKVRFVTTKEWVIDELVDNVKVAKTPDGDGKLQLNAANTALTLIGKELGMFIDRKEIRTGPLEDVPDEQLDAIIAESQAIIDAAKAQGTRH